MRFAGAHHTLRELRYCGSLRTSLPRLAPSTLLDVVLLRRRHRGRRGATLTRLAPATFLDVALLRRRHVLIREPRQRNAATPVAFVRCGEETNRIGRDSVNVVLFGRLRLPMMRFAGAHHILRGLAPATFLDVALLRRRYVLIREPRQRNAATPAALTNRIGRDSANVGLFGRLRAPMMRFVPHHILRGLLS